MEDAGFALYAMLLCFESTEPRNACLTAALWVVWQSNNVAIL